MRHLVLTAALLAAWAEPAWAGIADCNRSGGRWMGNQPEGRRCICENLMHANACNALANRGDVCVTAADCAAAERKQKERSAAPEAPPAPAPSAQSSAQAPEQLEPDFRDYRADSVTRPSATCPAGYTDKAAPCVDGEIRTRERTCFCHCPPTHRYVSGNRCVPRAGTRAAPQAQAPAQPSAPAAPTPFGEWTASPAPPSEEESDESASPSQEGETDAEAEAEPSEETPVEAPEETPAEPDDDSGKSACQRLCEQTEGIWSNEKAICACPRGRQLDSSLSCKCVEERTPPPASPPQGGKAGVGASVQADGTIHAYTPKSGPAEWGLTIAVPYLWIDSEVVTSRGGGIAIGLLRASRNLELFGDGALMITSREHPRGFSARLGLATTPESHFGLAFAASYSALGITSRQEAEVTHLGLHVGPVVRVFDALRLELLWSPGWVEHRQESVFEGSVLQLRAGVAWGF